MHTLHLSDFPYDVQEPDIMEQDDRKQDNHARIALNRAYGPNWSDRYNNHEFIPNGYDPYDYHNSDEWAMYGEKPS
jgi:hypothetical protein